MNIVGKNIGIREFQEQDIVPFFDATTESIEHMKEFMPWCHSEYSLKESEEWVLSQIKSFANGDDYNLVIYSLETEMIIGSVAINQINHQHKIGNIGYWVRRQSLKHGVATEAVLLVKKYGFNTLGLERLEIVMQPNNKASIKVAEKVGAKFEGILQKRLSVYGESLDACMYSLVNNA